MRILRDLSSLPPGSRPWLLFQQPCKRKGKKVELPVTTPPTESRNPFYLLLLLASLLFVATALAYALIPVLEQKAADAGQPPPPSELRAALRAEGGRWLLYEVAAVVVLAAASMVLDRLRSLQKQRAAAKITPTREDKTSP